MDIKDAAHFLKNGQKIKKANWPVDIFLILSGDMVKIHSGSSILEYHFDIFDILSDDWEIYK